jgi:hypothetical protein
VPDVDAEGGFLSRWSRRKLLQRQGIALPEPPASADPVPLPRPPAPQDAGAATALPPAAEPERPAATLPTLADVAALTRDSDYARFVAPGVDSEVRNAALKQLFTDPHFNLMDGLDIYIDDYSRPDPLPAGMLRQMAQSKFLGLFSDEDALAALPPVAALPDGAALPPVAAPESLPGASAAPETACDEDPALRLQPHPAAGPPGAGAGLVTDPGRQH